MSRIIVDKTRKRVTKVVTADAGVDIVKIAELMGHQSILTTRRYTHATDEGKRAAIAQLASYRSENCHKFATNEMRLAS